MICNYIFRMPARLNHNGVTSSNASDFPKMRVQRYKLFLKEQTFRIIFYTFAPAFKV